MTVVAAPLAPDAISPEESFERISSVRITPDNDTVLKNLGCLRELAGTWRGYGFNLIARPDFEDKTNLYLQLNQTSESLVVTPIGSSIPNRGFGQKDIELFGLTYLQKISDAAKDGALHIEPGIWIIQPETSYPDEKPGVGECLVARMGTIPHGNSLLAQGVGKPFRGDPTLKTATESYAFSLFPSFNSTPFPTTPSPGPPNPLANIFNAAGSSEKQTALNQGAPPPGFFQYDIANAAGPIALGGNQVLNTRTPFNTSPQEPPITAATTIDGLAIQDIVNDPIVLLQNVINKQKAEGCTFEGVALNISTQAAIMYFTKPNSNAASVAAGDTVTVKPTNGAGGVENILFLLGDPGTGPADGPNAQTATVYATFWIEKVTHPHHAPFMQLQYAQMVLLNFPIFAAEHPAPGSPNPPVEVNFSWPHITVATLRKSFN